MLTVHLAYELRGTMIKVNSANSGFTNTDLSRNTGTQPVEVGAIEATRLYLWGECGMEVPIKIPWVRSRVIRIRHPRGSGPRPQVLARTCSHATWSGPVIIHAVALVA